MNTRHHRRAGFGRDASNVGRLMAEAIDLARAYDEARHALLKMVELNDHFQAQLEHIRDQVKGTGTELGNLILQLDAEYQQKRLLLAADFYEIRERSGVVSNLDFAAAVGLPLAGTHFADDHRLPPRRSPGRSDTHAPAIVIARKTG